MTRFFSLSIAIVLGLGAPATRAAHDESLGARFVQLGGVDAGECLDHDAPCRSIAYALAQAEPGHTVKVGAGVFDMTGVDPETFLHGPIRATGGYDDTDHYLESRPAAVQSVVVGVDARYRNPLAVRGFYWAENPAAAARGEISLAGGVALQAAQSMSTACTQGFAGQFPCRNLDFLAQVSLPDFSSRPISAANLWGFVDLNDNREYAVIGLRNGTAIVDVTDPASPREVTTIAGNASPWREVKIYQVYDSAAMRWRAYAYVSTEAANSGLQTIDLSGLPQTATLASTNLDTGSQHTLYVSNIDYATNAALPGAVPFLYVAGANVGGGAWRAYGLANPAAPTLAGTSPTTHYMHDSTSLLVSDARTSQCAPGHSPCEVLVDFDVDQVELWDATDKVQPQLLGTATNPNNRYIHSGWPTADGQHVIFHDELEEIQNGLPTSIYTLDVTTLTAPTVTVSYRGATTTTDHNGYTLGNYYYMAHYRRGVVVFDASNPSQLVEVASFDNYLSPASNIAGTDGTWGVYPFLPSGTLIASDIENGLFVLRDHARSFGSNAGRLGFEVLAASAAESSGNARVHLRRVVGNAGAVSIQYATGDGSAVAGTDYLASAGTLDWPAGDMTDKVIDVPLVNDVAAENAEAFSITLSSPTGGAQVDGTSTLTVTITDNDRAVTSGGGGGGAVDLAALLWLAGLALVAALPRYLAPQRSGRRGTG
jgi:choice-of-anchor B domain-containing protein